MKPLPFKRQQRLLNAADYTQVFDHVDVKISHPSFLLLARRVPESPAGRLGLIAAKKHLRLAVQRNRFKRIVRESFRHHQRHLCGVDLIVMARSGAMQASPTELRSALDQTWLKLGKRLGLAQTESPPDPDGGSPGC